MQNPSNLLVLVLAGGEGRRIGGGKAERLLGGERLLDHAIRQARQWSEHVVIAAGSWEREGVVGINQLTFAFGPSLVGIVRDRAGTYGAALWTCALLEAISAALILLGPGPAEKARES